MSPGRLPRKREPDRLTQSGSDGAGLRGHVRDARAAETPALPIAHIALSVKMRIRLRGQVQLSKKEERATNIRVKTISGYQIKGATASAQRKPAVTETGLIVQVPPFIGTGEKIRVSTEDGTYQERVK